MAGYSWPPLLLFGNFEHWVSCYINNSSWRRHRWVNPPKWEDWLSHRWFEMLSVGLWCGTKHARQVNLRLTLARSCCSRSVALRWMSVHRRTCGQHAFTYYHGIGDGYFKTVLLGVNAESNCLIKKSDSATTDTEFPRLVLKMGRRRHSHRYSRHLRSQNKTTTRCWIGTK